MKDNAICKTHSLAIGHSDQPPVDVNPGEISEVTLTFDRPGKYTFYCTRWCSINHWRMRGVIEVTDAPGASTGSLVYDNGFPPASVVAHGHDGQTWITLVDSPQQGIHTSLGAAIQDAIW